MVPPPIDLYDSIEGCCVLGLNGVSFDYCTSRSANNYTNLWAVDWEAETCCEFEEAASFHMTCIFLRLNNFLLILKYQTKIATPPKELPARSIQTAGHLCIGLLKSAARPDLDLLMLLPVRVLPLQTERVSIG